MALFAASAHSRLWHFSIFDTCELMSALAEGDVALGRR